MADAVTCLWTGAEISAAGFEIEPATAVDDLCVTGVSIDSRSIKPGELFVALRDARDGHEFVAAAFKTGAAAALVDNRPVGLGAGTLVLSADSLEGLKTLGLAGRRRAKAAKRVAVTGSVGKTSTKEALAHVFSDIGPTHASVASYNNHWGVPLTLARMPRETQFGIFEIGMNHAGEITPLSQLVVPDVAIITTVEAVHLEHFDSVEGIADAKGEVFAGLAPGGTAILNRDNPYYERLLGHATAAKAGRVLTFGTSPEADCQLSAFEPLPDRARVEAKLSRQVIQFELAAEGLHNAMNSMAVLLAVSALGFDPAAAAKRLETYSPPSGRGARETIVLDDGSFVLVDESYNANPASMRAALSNLVAAKPEGDGRRIAVLGDMLELGPQAPQFHAQVAEAVAGVDLVFTCGTHMKSLYEALASPQRALWAQTSVELAEAVATEIRAGDVVMIKGSLGSKMKLIVERVRGLAASAGND